MKDKILFFLYFFGLICLFLYSYTQVDLNLTLSQNPAVLSFQRYFQQIGFFQRPLSMILFLSILFLLFILYIIFLRNAQAGHINKKQMWILILSAAIILNFSYNAFSYDLFNYIFDAKVITHYHLNPYNYRALDFPSDPMLLFMHWTHRLYPYGPTWLGLTIPLSFLGMGFFIPTLLLFKTLATVCFLGTAYFINKTLKLISPSNEKFGTIFFALNPLVLIESLVSAHNDIVMVFLVTIAIYFLVTKKHLHSFIFLILSAGVKFATGLLLPILIYVYFKKEKIKWDRVFLYSIILMTFGIIFASVRTNFQPWYILYIFPFAAFLARKEYILFPTITISAFAIANYLPFLGLGNWDNPVPTELFLLNTAGIVISLILILFKYRKI